MLANIEEKEIETDQPLPRFSQRHRAMDALRCNVIQTSEKRREMFELGFEQFS